jgi:hypothetical protein
VGRLVIGRHVLFPVADPPLGKETLCRAAVRSVW